MRKSGSYLSMENLEPGEEVEDADKEKESNQNDKSKE